MGRSVTAIHREETARQNEASVLTASSFANERRVSVIRLVMMGMFFVSQEVVVRLLGGSPSHDPVMLTLVGIYAALSLGLFIGLKRVQSSPAKAIFFPILWIAIDFGMLTAMAIRQWQLNGKVYPEMGAIAFAIVLGFNVARYRLLHVVLATAAAIGCYLFIGGWTRTYAPIPDSFVVGGFLALGLLVGMTNRSVSRMFTDLRRRDNLSRFLPRAIVERLLSEEGAASLAPVQCEVTVLFIDIRDFTTLSEHMQPRQVLELVDEILGHMAHIVKAHDGVVNKFLGDGMLAFWGVPERTPEHPELALRAALDMRRKIAELNETRVVRDLVPIRIGVGVHTGTVAAGMLGGADQHEYTVIGDAVNVASRIEGLTKRLGVDLLISQTTWALMGGKHTGERLAEETVKGRRDPVVVYSVTA
jgi:adenylate cyclase